MSATFSLLSSDSSQMGFSRHPSVADLIPHTVPGRVNWITLSGISLQGDHAAVKALFDHLGISASFCDRVFRGDPHLGDGHED